MKYCVVSVNNLSMVPYFSVYKKVLKAYDLIYWDRNQDDEEFEAEQVFKFSNVSEKKMNNYLAFLWFTAKILRKKRYDKVIFLHSQIGIALYPLIVHLYKGKYVCDIRDYEYENKWIYRFLEKKFVEHSAINIISSPGYREFLPEAEYHVLHNDRLVAQEYIDQKNSRDKQNKIVIGNIGLIRFHNQNKKLIMALKNDPRFELLFYGTGSEELESFCKENQVRNVKLKPYFPASETMGYVAQCDVIFNLYGNHTPHLDYALSNKLYLAAHFASPILVCPDTYMETVSVANGFGIVVDLESDRVADVIWDEYQRLMGTDLQHNCEDFVEEVERENAVTLNLLRKGLQL